MSLISLRFRSGTARTPVALRTPDIATALAVADIAVPGGRAELYEKDRRIARLTRYGDDGAAFWKVD